MGGIYRSPLRVYLVLGLLSLIGVWSAFQLPISLFPNSSKPQVSMCINTNLSPDAFLSTYGSWIEGQLRAIRRDSLEVEKVSAAYRPKDVCYDIDFKWGGDPSQALREVESVSNAVQGRLPQESRDRVSVGTNRDNGGFLALSFYSNQRSLTELYNILEPVLTPKLSRVPDAQDAFLFNPQQRQLLIELKPEQLAALQLFPNDIASAVLRALDSYGGGSLTVDTTNLRIEFPRPVKTLDDFKLIQVPTSSGRAVTLGEIAHLDLTVPLDSTRIFKTSGMSSVILMAFPKPGGNVKSMAEDVMKAVKETMPSLPSDIQYSSLVDPSEFIRSAVTNVTHEVGLSAFLAVVILFLFVGNLKNVVTAAIEIPLSIVLAFILMKLTGMNLNLISLGGLALSAGMNVDASVVVMENIFRHFEARHGEKLSFDERLHVIVTAVREVQFSVIASTIASLVVFIPLAFTSELSNAILGDLAKAVVFSHGFSAVVALVLVPTIRLQMMKDGAKAEAPSLFEKPLTWLEETYARTLGWFLERASVKLATYAGLSVLLALLIGFVIPRLPKEIIGKPDTDWLILGISTNGNTVVRQMEAQTEAVENELLTKFGDKILYTFTQIQRPNNSNIMFRLRDKHDMSEILKGVEETFTNTPLTSYWSDSWNPAELPLPDPADFEVSIRGSDNKAMAETARDLYNELQEKKLFSRVRVNPNAWADKSVIVRPKMEQWQLLANQGVPISIASLADLTRTATVGRPVIKTEIENETMDVFMRFSENYVVSPEELAALPVGVGSRIVPLKALAEVSREEGDLPIFRENGRRLFSLQARVKKDELSQKDSIVASAAEVVTNWPNRKTPQVSGEPRPTIDPTTDPSLNLSTAKAEPKQLPTLQIEDSQKELHDALKQLVTAVSLSIVLIFLTMVFQFGSLVNSLLVLVAVPLGFVGVILSLWLFRSTLSLNSMLGVILLNGLAVANSIILVDFLQRAVKAGQSPKQAAVEVARTRLRPILMTSMTTGLGMLPVALGLGEGGKILQPLGIAVAGGLGFSMITTLFVVPALQVTWLEFREKRSPSAIPTAASIVASVFFALCLPWNANAQGTASAKDAFLVKPQLESAEGLSFADAWTQILDRSLRLETQKLEVETSSARRLQTIGGFLPSVALKGTESTSGEPFSGPRRSASVEASVNVFRSGGDLAALSGASKDLDSAKYRLESERQAAQLDAATALFTVIARTQQTRIYETIVKLKTESLRVARERFASGLLPQQEVDKVAVELENAKARAIDAGTSEADARARLKSLLGQDSIAIVWPWKQSLTADPRLEETEFKLEARPDWQAAHATTDAESARKRAALARFFPSLDFSLSYGNADLTDPSRRDWAAMATLSIPLFERLNSFAGYKIQTQALKVAQVREESVTREAGPEVEASRLSFRAARTSALARDKTAKLSEKLFDDNFQRFRLGRATVNELAFDQNRLFESELLAVDGWLAAHTTFVRLCHALGYQITAGGACAF